MVYYGGNGCDSVVTPPPTKLWLGAKLVSRTVECVRVRGVVIFDEG